MTWDSNLITIDSTLSQRFTINITLANGTFTWSVVARAYNGQGQEQTGNVARSDIYGLTVNVGGNIYYKGDIAWSNYTPGSTVYSGTTPLANCSISNGAVGVSLIGNFYYGTWNTNYRASINNSFPVASPTVATPTYTATNKYGDTIVGGITTLTFSFSATPGTSGNTITNYALYQDGVAVYSGATAGCTIYAPQGGSHTYYVVATESNGATGQSSTITVTTETYTFPAFTSVSSVRWSTGDSSGAASDIGTYGKLTATFTKSSVGNTELATTCKVMVSTYTGTTTTSGTSLYTGSILSPDSSYTVTYKLYDSFIGETNAVIVTDTLSMGARAFDLIHDNTDGYGVAVAQKATPGYMDIALPVRIHSIDSSGTITSEALMGSTATHQTGFTVTRSSGMPLNAVTMHTFGRIAHLTIQFAPTVNYSAGNNIFVGSISSFLPVSTILGVGYYGSGSYVGAIATDGSITVRAVANLGTAGGGVCSISFTYLF